MQGWFAHVLRRRTDRKTKLSIYKQDGTTSRDALCPSSEKEGKKGNDDDTISE